MFLFSKRGHELNGPQKTWPSGRVPGFSSSTPHPSSPASGSSLSMPLWALWPVSYSWGESRCFLTSVTCMYCHSGVPSPPSSHVPLLSSLKSHLCGISSMKPDPTSQLDLLSSSTSKCASWRGLRAKWKHLEHLTFLSRQVQFLPE